MDLLFPIAAILFLLSGVSAPARLHAQQENAAALMRQILTRGSAAHLRTPTAASSVRRSTRQPAAPAIVAQPGSAQRGLAPRIISGVRGSGRKQFRTRFGFAEGAYRSTAPPSA